MEKLISAPHYKELVNAYHDKKRQHRQLQRYLQLQERFSRDKSLSLLCSTDPSPAFKHIKRARMSKDKSVGKLNVGDRTYFGDSVPDGMFESIKQLKTGEEDLLHPDLNQPDFSKEYSMILDICKAGKKIPPLSRARSNKILESVPEI